MKTANFYSSDRPISSKGQDLLGRAGFAERLALDIQSWRGQDSLVIALFGAWGSGKSSLKNMILESLQRNESDRIPVLEFNPWQLSGTGNIPAVFFRELSIAVQSEGTQSDAEDRSKKLNAYATGLTLVGTTTEFVGKAMPWLGVPAGPIVETVGHSLKAAGASAKEGSEAHKAVSETQQKSLQVQKTELAELLRQLPSPVLIVIDDIDRLTTDEILQVFQLVKANGDFPQLIYLLLFEREIVSKALNNVSGGKGTEFLEKIVQVAYHIPNASQSSVYKALFNGLNQLIDQHQLSTRWDKHRWIELFNDGIAEYFRNLRHVYRFLASLAFHVRQHRRGESFEVNPVDLIGLETLRVFEPSVYERIPGAKELVTGSTKSRMFGELKREVIDAGLEEIASVATENNKGKVKTVLQLLFPPITSGFSSSREFMQHEQDWLRELRVCHPDFFDKYFTMTIADNDLSQEALENLMRLADDHNKFIAACEALDQRGLLKLAFERLDAFKDKIPLEHMESLICALCDLSDKFPNRAPGLLEQDLNSYAWRITCLGLHREKDLHKRLVVLKSALASSTGLTLPFEIVSLNERSNKADESIVEQADLEVLKKICVEKLQNAAKVGCLRQNPRLKYLLFKWHEWGGKNEVRAWLAENMQSAKDAAWLLSILMEETHAYGRDHRIIYNIKLGILEQFSDLDVLTRLLEQEKDAVYSKLESIAIRKFKDALKRRSEGKPDDACEHYSDEGELVE